ncbi:hypothetical protein [Zavarzinia sp. CC-PAN008]|uniref:Bbp19 family protein n=1 Tax=Zavarzinia sp. CC-PAN008 TaxID=3243332 RepID=UPI003F744761
MRLWFRRDPDEGRELARDAAVRRAYRTRLSGPDGHLMLVDLVRRGGVIRPTASSDPIELARWEGRRAMVLEILELAHLTHDDIARMLARDETEGARDEDFPIL